MSFGPYHIAIGLTLIFLGSDFAFAQNRSDENESTQGTVARGPVRSRLEEGDRFESKRPEGEHGSQPPIASTDKSPDAKWLFDPSKRPFKTAVSKMNGRVSALFAKDQKLVSTTNHDPATRTTGRFDSDRPNDSRLQSPTAETTDKKRLASGQAAGAEKSTTNRMGDSPPASGQRLSLSSPLSHDIISQAELETLKSHLRKPMGPLRRAWGTLKATPKGSVANQSIDRTTSPP